MNSKPTLLAEVIAEFLGTFVLILFGTGVVAMVVLFPSVVLGAIAHGGFTNITLGWGLGVTMGIYVAGKISGAHLNPAVTLTFAVFRDFPWRKVLPYCAAQTAGAFVAAALVYWNYLPVTSPSFCTSGHERVYITARGCEIGFGTHGLQAAGAGGL